MPRIRRRARIRKPDISELNKDQRRHLERGSSYFGGFGEDLELFTAAWEAHGETILPEWIAQHPGTRPFAWWLLDHRQERPVIDQHPLTEKLLPGLRAKTFGYLFHELLRVENNAFVPMLESQVGYLDRLGLLTAAEREVLGRPER